MVGAIVHQLSNGTMGKDWLKMNSSEYYADNGVSVFPQSSQGAPFTAASIAVTGDPLTNLYEDMAAEAATLQEQQKIQPKIRIKTPFEYLFSYPKKVTKMNTPQLCPVCKIG